MVTDHTVENIVKGIERQRRIRTAVLGMTLILLAIVILKPPRTDTPGTLTYGTPDKMFEIFVPLAALPDGFSSDDIRVERVAAEDALGAPVTVFRLLPSGLALKAPVAFMAVVPMNFGEFPLVLHVSTTTGAIETISDLRVRVDHKNAADVVTGTIDHFSYIVLGKSGIVAAMEPNEDQRLGVPHVVGVSIGSTKDGDTHLVKVDDAFTIQYTRKGSAVVSGDLTTRGETLAPERFSNALARIAIPPGGTVRGGGTFTCMKNGSAIPTFEFRVETTVEAEWMGTSFLSAAGDVFLGRKIEIETTDGVYFVGNEGYNCFGIPQDEQNSASASQEVPEKGEAATAPSGTSARVKICGLPGGPPCPSR